jgi:hypothetical protein
LAAGEGSVGRVRNDVLKEEINGKFWKVSGERLQM